MRIILTPFLAFIKLLYQSIYLAGGQIWANKVRSILTTTGIVIGVASVTSVIAVLTGLKAQVVDSFESLGTNKIFISMDRPREGRFKNASWRVIRFRPEQFDGMLERCPSIDNYTLMAEQSQTVYYGVHKVENVTVSGINPSWHGPVGQSLTT